MSNDSPYFVAQKQLKDSGGNPAALLGNILALEKMVLNLVNTADPNSIASQLTHLQEMELLNDEIIIDFARSCAKLKRWTDEYRKSVNFFSQEYRSQNERSEKPKLDLNDNVIPIEKAKTNSSSKRFANLEID